MGSQTRYVVKLSAKLFWGLQIELYEDEVYGLSRDEQSVLITLKAKTKLKCIFRNHGLELLIEEVDKLSLHLHHLLKVNEINYACDHDHNH
jgi:hypothetical protein